MASYMWDNLFRHDDQDLAVLEALRQTYLFRNLSNKELKLVKETVHVRNFQPGETVFRQGEVGVGMYVILKGSLEIVVDARMSSGKSDAHLVTRLKGGDFLGELSLIESNSRRTATARAVDESILIGFFRPDLFEILERQPAIGVKILLALSEILGRRLKETTVKVSELKDELRQSGDNA